ncbi:SCAN box domain-containing protein [Trichonephila clavipes]|nr:SCAN box domain-containing protein [Trichonephila clavipes]
MKTRRRTSGLWCRLDRPTIVWPFYCGRNRFRGSGLSPYLHNGELSSKAVKRRQWAGGGSAVGACVGHLLVGKTGRKKKRKREREKEGKRARKRQGLVVLGSGEENPRVLLVDADQESETRMSKNALRTGRRQAVDAREVLAFRFFPEKDEEDVSSVSTCNVKKEKDVLLEVAKELRVEIDITLPKSEIKNRICQSEDYNEESVKSLLEGILAEKREARELKENRETREFEERKLIKAFELERMKLANSTDTISVASTDLEGQGINRRVNLRDLVPKFDAKNADINLFFEIFERQAKKEKVAEDRWVSQLIPLLPIEIAEIVAKEPLEKSDDYPHIKKIYSWPGSNSHR